MQKLFISSPSFKEGGLIPVKHTGYGEDISPALQLEGLSQEAISIAIIMNDMSHFIPAFNHWVIWNIPPMPTILENIPHGGQITAPANTVQGRGYGKNRYRGPKPPFNWSHIYHFNIFALDCSLNLPCTARKKDVIRAMEGHILQQALLTGHYR